MDNLIVTAVLPVNCHPSISCCDLDCYVVAASSPFRSCVLIKTMLWVRTQAESLSIVRVYAHTRTPLRQRLRQPDMETWQMKCRNCNGVFQGNSSQRESYVKQYFQPSAPALRRPVSSLVGAAQRSLRPFLGPETQAARKTQDIPRHPHLSEWRLPG